MRQSLRPFIFFVLLLLPVFSFGQQPSRSETTGVPGACGSTGNVVNATTRTGPNPSPLNGNGTLGNIYNNTACGLNWSSASQRLGQRFSPAGAPQPAPFAISGIPACATVLKAYLWAEGSGNGAAQTATVNGPFGTANYPMAIVGQGPDKCWSYSGSYTYRADVTPSVGGNGTYNISGILTNPPTSGNDMDGATLLVIWSDPTQTYRGTMIIDDGAIIVNGGVANYTMTYPAVCGATTNAQSFIALGDIQMAVTSVTANSTPVPVTWNWWNFEVVNTTVTSGQSSSLFSCNTSGDCFNLCIAGLYYRTTCVACTPTSSVTLTTSSTPASCSACNGTATVTASPAGAYTYSWSPSGGTGSTASGLCAGTYTVTVTASCGTATATVVVPSSGGSITLNNTSQTNVSCNGSCNGAATVTASGGTGPYTFAWSPAVTNSTTGSSNTATNLCAGTYVCTATDAGGCTGTQTITITQPPAITATQSQVNVTCNGSCNGSATVVASGGTGTYTYSWAPTGGTGATASGLCAGTYTCTISSPAGCSITKTFTITQPPAITATQSQVNVTCNGACNGSATVVASGGTGTYTYAWAPTGGTGATASGLCAGSYTCTISSPAGCSINVSFTITQPPAITATQSQTNVTCNAACNGTATVVASGGTGTYTYAWAPTGGTGATASGLCAGSYTCTISSPAGCSITQTFNITQPPAFTVTPSQVNVNCNGACNGSATVVVGGGSPPYSYSWAPTGGTGSTASSLCAGTYTCTFTDASGCTGTQTFSITQPTALTATTSFVSATCGNANGSATATPSGGTGPTYTYLWSPGGQTTQTATGLLAGVYTCTIHDLNNCVLTVTVTVPNAGSPTLTVTGFTNVTCNGACDGTATVSASGGTGPYTYNWTPTGGTGTTATGLCPGTYTCTVTDANGCTATATVLITQPPPITATQSQVNVTCNAACNGSATVVASGGTGTYTYAWAPSGGTGATASGLCAGTYTCTISSPAGCSINVSFTITQPPALTVTPSQVNVNCNGSCNGSATVVVGGGTPPYTYSWAPTGGTGSTASALCAGTYTCTYTDANGCTGTQTFTITQPTAVTATTSFVTSTCGNANGSATAIPSGGTGPTYTYLWNPGGQTTQTATNLLAGTYTCDIHDANGCLLTVTVTVPNAGSPTLTVTGSTNVTCNGACDGTATVSASGGSGPYTYNWTPSGGTGTTATGLCPGTYTCTVTDANGCTATATVLITEPPALSITPSQVDLVCNGVCNGSATVVVGGGTAPYTYSWSSGGTGSTESSLCAGSYTCTVTDLNGCTLTQTFTITEPTLLTVASAGFNVTCFGACDGQIVAIPSGGTGPTYTFAWSSGCTSASCNNICAGTYNVTVTDFNGCTATSTATVTEPTPISITTSTVDAHCNLADGSATSTFSGGTGTLTPVWYNPSTPGPNLNNVTAGSYYVVVTDANGCDDTANVTINNIPGVTATAGPVTNVSCFGGNNGSASVNVSGGTGTITYGWSCSPSTTNSATGLTAGTCTVTVTDSAGCTSAVNITITEPPALTLTATATPGAICAGQTSTITATAGGGTPVYNYGWQPGALLGQTQTVSPAATTTYTVYLSDVNACTDSTTVTVTVNPNPVAILSGDSLAGCAPHCVNFSDNSAIASGAITSWSWDFGDGNTSTQQNPNHCYALPGVYSVTLTVTSASGCTNTIVMPNYIQVFANPVAEFTASPQPTTELNPTIFFTDQSSGAVTWSWSFGDLLNSSSTLQNPSFPYPGPGCYDVILTATSINGCVDTTLHQVCIDPDVTLFVPNAFTPNDDGVNDIFKPQGIGMDPDHFELWIFDRWGNMIFYTDDFAKGWDGMVQGHSNPCQQDVYVWKIKATDLMGNKHNLIGHVSLIR